MANSVIGKEEGRGISSTSDNEVYNCLICNNLSGGQSSSSLSSALFTFSGDGGEGDVGGHLWSVFVLRHVLQLEDDKCCQLLEKFGGEQSPGEWFSVCESCSEGIGELYKILVTVRRLDRKMEGIRKELRSRVCQGSCGYRGGKSQRGGHEGMHSPQDEIRQLIFADELQKNSDGLERLGVPKLRKQQTRMISIKRRRNVTPLLSIVVAGGAEDVESKSEEFTEQSPTAADSEWELPPVQVVTTDLISSDTRRRKARNERNRKSSFVREKAADILKRKNRVRKSTYKSVFSAGIPYYCDHCPVIFASKKVMLKHHHKWHFTRALVVCPTCGTKFETKQLLQTHCQNSHNEFRQDAEEANDLPAVKQECSFCNERFSSKTANDFHTASIHFKEAFLTCKECGFQAKKFGVFRKHMGSHSGAKDYVCEICSKAYSTPSGLYTHRRLEHGEELGLKKLVQCPRCDMKFISTAAMELHVKIVHEKNKQHICEFCGKGFCTAETLRHHTLLHTASNERHYKKGPFTCEYCQAQFNVRQGLYYHMKRMHNDKYLHKCKTCGKGYCSTNGLIQHRRKCSLPKTLQNEPD